MNHLNKKRSGYALVTVILVVAVLSILFASMITITQNNTKQVAMQEDNMRAHYLARSGIDLAYAALMAASTDPGNLYKMDDFVKTTAYATTPLTDTITFPNVGTVTISVKHDANWIYMTAVGQTLAAGSSRVTLKISRDNYAVFHWENN